MDQDLHVLGDDGYRQLLGLRADLRRFLRRSEGQAKAAGITAAQHELLLAIRGHTDPAGPTIGEVAGYLLLKHHSAVELAQRAESAGLVARHEDPDDRRLVRLALSAAGAAALEQLTSLHVEEIMWLGGVPGREPCGVGADASEPRTAASPTDPAQHVATAPVAQPTPAPEPASAAGAPRAAVSIAVGRVYDRPTPEAGMRILVDRLWPRGVQADGAPFDEWLSGIAPSTELRRWFDHVPERFAVFAERYRAELLDEHEGELDRLTYLALDGPLVLLTATKDVERSSASVLADVVRYRTAVRGA